MQVAEVIEQPGDTVEAERRRSLIRAKIREGMNKLSDAYDFSRSSAEGDAAEAELDTAIGLYVKGELSIEGVREKFRTYVAAHEIAPALF